MSGGGSSSQIIGYKYYLGMHLVLCHGPVDAVTEIVVGDRSAWTGEVTANGQITVDAPNLFGGEKREGGVAGAVDVMMGGAEQTANDYLLSKIGSPMPAFRGVVSLVLRRVYLAAMNPYLKPWAVRVKRILAGWDGAVWYPEKASVPLDGGGVGMNPAHIIYQCLTDRRWGMGYDASVIEAVAFSSAADVFHGEALGLNLLWTQQQSIQDFIGIIADHAGAVLAANPSTGRFELRPIRADYDPDSLPVFGPDQVIELESLQRAGLGELTGELIVNYTDPTDWSTRSVAVKNLATLQAQGQTVSQTREYPGITDPDLAARIGMRDLAALSNPIAKVRLKINRAAWRLAPGDVFRWVSPSLGEDIVLRVGAVRGGTLTDRTVTVEAVEDVFFLPRRAYIANTPKWCLTATDPYATPPATAQGDYVQLLEATYWQLARTMTRAEFDYVTPDDGYIGVVASNMPGAFGYTASSRLYAPLVDQVDNPYTDPVTGTPAPCCVLVADCDAQDSLLVVDHWSGREDAVVGVTGGASGLAMLGGELVQVTGAGEFTLTVSRGMLDTTPQAHAAGVVLQFLDGAITPLPTAYVESDDVEVAVAPFNGLWYWDPAMPSTVTSKHIVLAGRHHRPYPPGNVAINAEAWPDNLVGDTLITWSHRDRTLQTAYLVAQEEGNIGPEPGTTYTVRIFGEDDQLIHTATGLTGTCYLYPQTQELADTTLDRVQARLSIEIESIRDTAAAWQPQRRTAPHEGAGWGLNWGRYWGGTAPRVCGD